MNRHAHPHQCGGPDRCPRCADAADRLSADIGTVRPPRGGWADHLGPCARTWKTEDWHTHECTVPIMQYRSDQGALLTPTHTAPQCVCSCGARTEHPR